MLETNNCEGLCDFPEEGIRNCRIGDHSPRLKPGASRGDPQSL